MVEINSHFKFHDPFTAKKICYSGAHIQVLQKGMYHCPQSDIDDSQHRQRDARYNFCTETPDFLRV